jgi:hypothetical protein
MYLVEKGDPRLFRRAAVSIGLIIALVFMGIGNVFPAYARADTSTYYVATTGTDSSGCGTTALPCRSIQYAVNLAQSGDTIKVAGGTYTYPDLNLSPACYGASITPPVVCIVNENLTLLGGFSTSDWSNSDPLAYPSIIDGQNQYRGVALYGMDPNQALASLDLEDFTIQNGLAQGATDGADDQIGAYGGGMYATNAPLTLRNLVFSNNRALGGNTSSSYGGAGSGGGLAINLSPPATTCILDQVTFADNQAVGGTGGSRGGLALGGGFYFYSAVVSTTYLTLTGNLAQAGSTSGSGIDIDGSTADGLGGGGAVFGNSNVTLQYVTATENQAIGGNASTQGGNGQGGALYAELVDLIDLVDSNISANQGIGGNAANGGIGGGGGIRSENSNLVVDRTMIINNTTTGGVGNVAKGSTGGGGFYVSRSVGDTTISIVNSVIAGNRILVGGGNGDSVGGGGGLWVQGVTINITHATIAGNIMDPSLLFGLAAIFVNFGSPTPTVANISYTVISDHIDNHGVANVTQMAIYNWQGNTVNFTGGVFANNTNDTNAEEGPPIYPTGPGTFTGLNSVATLPAVSYIAPGSPNFNYHIPLGSQLIDTAAGSAMTVDIDNQDRPNGSAPDAGADEYWPFPLTVSSGDGSLYLNWSQGVQVLAGGVGGYQVMVTCPTEAKSPNEGNCGSPINVPSGTTSYTLTGLSNYKSYIVTVNADNVAGGEIASSVSVTAVPESKAFLPLIVNK